MLEGRWEVCGENKKLEDVGGVQEVGDKVEVRTTNHLKSKGVYIYGGYAHRVAEQYHSWAA